METHSITGSHALVGSAVALPLTGLSLVWLICVAALCISIMFALLRFVPRREL